MPRLKVGVIFGGASEEHPVSVKSAAEISRHLDLEKYEPHYVGITRGGAWRLCEGPGPDWESGGVRPAILSPDRDVRGLLVLDGERYETIGLDLAFPVLHGRFGEDGAMQGLLELAGIPYVGCDIQSSAVCMDKALTYVVAAGAGIATPRFRVLAAGEEVDPGGLAYPVFVKPARSGSSFGVAKVGAAADLAAAVEAARRYDPKVLIEEAVVGSEIGCAVSGTSADPFVGEVDRIALSHGFFRIHQEDDPEGGSDNATFIVPADISAESTARVKETAKAIYRALGCSGLARVDLFLTDGGEVVLNEVNTFPGMTSYSRYPRMMEAAGVSRGEMIDRMVASALAGGRR